MSTDVFEIRICQYVNTTDRIIRIIILLFNNSYDLEISQKW